jgi:uncharacterized small protein (DUF1192 family)
MAEEKAKVGPAILAAVQELREEVKALRAEVAELKAARKKDDDDDEEDY